MAYVPSPAELTQSIRLRRDLSLDNATGGNLKLVGDQLNLVMDEGDLLATTAADGTSNLQTRVETVLRIPYVGASFSANNDLIIFNANSPKFVVTDAYLRVGTPQGGAMTVTLRNALAGAGGVVSSPLDLNGAAGSIDRTVTLANTQFAAGSTLAWNANGNPTAAVGELYIHCYLLR